MMTPAEAIDCLKLLHGFSVPVSLQRDLGQFKLGVHPPLSAAAKAEMRDSIVGQ